MENNTAFTAELCPMASTAAEFRTHVRCAVALFGGKWKLEIIWLLGHRIHRFNELRRALPGVTQHMLTAQLRELEGDGLVRRTVFPEVPPRVEYQITDEAHRLRPLFEAIFKWAGEPRSANQLKPARNRRGNGVADRARLSATRSKLATP